MADNKAALQQKAMEIYAVLLKMYGAMLPETATS